eukprot:4846750-Prymnesium_polylepis.1
MPKCRCEEARAAFPVRDVRLLKTQNNGGEKMSYYSTHIVPASAEGPSHLEVPLFEGESRAPARE